MTLDRIAAGLAAASLLFTSPGFGDTWEAEPRARISPRACTPEAQKCLEKLETRLRFHGHIHGWSRIENALLELQDTDPGCALLLQGRAFQGF